MSLIHPSPRTRRFLLAVAGGTWAAAVTAGEPPRAPHPADPGAAMPSEPYRGALPDSARGYLQAIDVPRLPWPRLFQPDGSFAPVPDADAAMAAMPMDKKHAGHSMPAGAAMPAMPMAPGAGSDARGVVKTVDTAEGKVKLKHGPIARLDMPGMTMVFRVKDKALLEGLAPGDEVGFTVEMDGTTFYITRISK